MSGTGDISRIVRARSSGGLILSTLLLSVVLLLPIGASAAGDLAGNGGPPEVVVGPTGRDASCPRGSKPAIVAGSFKCLRAGQLCKARYQKAYRKYGFKCVNGRLRTTVPPTPKPPVPPPGQPGHYKGTTSQNELFEFDVTSDGRGVTNVVTGQINQGCNGGFTLWGGAGTWVSGRLPIDSSGRFTVDFPYQNVVNASASNGRFTLTGHLNGAVGVGNFQVTTNFIENGVAYACGSGLQTWTVTRIS